MDTDTIGLIVLIAAVLVIIVAGKLQKRKAEADAAQQRAIASTAAPLSAGRSSAGLVCWLGHSIDGVPPPLTIEVAVSMNDPVIRCLNQAEEQCDRKEQAKAVQPLPDLWLYPSSQAAQMVHCAPNSR